MTADYTQPTLTCDRCGATFVTLDYAVAADWIHRGCGGRGWLEPVSGLAACNACDAADADPSSPAGYCSGCEAEARAR